MSFVGTYRHTLDAKKRVFIPSKFREELGDEFYITRKSPTFLSIYTAEDWDELVDKISQLPESEAGPVQDYVLGPAQKCIPDTSGRIILGEDLVKLVKIEKNVAFVGSGRQIRLFAEEVWDERERNRDYEKLREIMRQYGL